MVKNKLLFILAFVGIFVLLMIGIYSNNYENQVTPPEPSKEFKDNLNVGEITYHPESGLYYSVTKGGTFMATGGPDAIKNMQTEIEARE